MIRSRFSVVLGGLIVAAVAHLGLGFPALAKPQDSAAVELASVMLPREAYRQTIHQVAEGLVLGAKSSGQPLPPDFATKLEAVVAEALPYAEQVKFTSEVYAKRFSGPELRELIQFYQTPTGAKLVRELPGITQDVAQAFGSLLPQRLPPLMKKHGLAP